MVEEGGEVSLECEVRGSPTPQIVWLLNGESLSNDSHARVRGKLKTVIFVEGLIFVMPGIPIAE